MDEVVEFKWVLGLNMLELDRFCEIIYQMLETDDDAHDARGPNGGGDSKWVWRWGSRARGARFKLMGKYSTTPHLLTWGLNYLHNGWFRTSRSYRCMVHMDGGRIRIVQRLELIDFIKSCCLQPVSSPWISRPWKPEIEGTNLSLLTSLYHATVPCDFTSCNFSSTWKNKERSLVFECSTGGDEGTFHFVPKTRLGILRTVRVIISITRKIIASAISTWGVIISRTIVTSRMVVVLEFVYRSVSVALDSKRNINELLQRWDWRVTRVSSPVPCDPCWEPVVSP